MKRFAFLVLAVCLSSGFMAKADIPPGPGQASNYEVTFGPYVSIFFEAVVKFSDVRVTSGYQFLKTDVVKVWKTKGVQLNCRVPVHRPDGAWEGYPGDSLCVLTVFGAYQGDSDLVAEVKEIPQP